jgi:hypothetical protein
MRITTRKTYIVLRALALGVIALAVILPAMRHRHTVPDVPLKDPKTLRRTLLVPTMQQPIVPGRSVIWCGSFQLAWNQFMELAGGAVELEPPYSGTEWLNRGIIQQEDLPPDSTFVHASMAGDPAELKEQVQEAMGPDVRTRALNRAAQEVQQPAGPYAYAYLRTSQRFPVRYRRLSEDLTFNGEPVKAFGFESDEPDARLKQQTSVLDYAGPDDFVLELDTEEPENRIILAKVPAETTLQGTVDAVIARADAANGRGPAAELRVPLMNYAVDERFEQIEGRTPEGPNATFPPVAFAGQSVSLRLDESGVTLESDAVVQSASAAALEPPVCVFDKPFLVLLRRGDRPPYFAFWVDNAELLWGAD